MADPQTEVQAGSLTPGDRSSAPPAPPSPLSGCYLLIIIGEPHSPEHKEIILQKIAKGFLSWDIQSAHVDLEKELETIAAQAPEGEEAKNGERLIQYASENLVTEVLIHPQLNTLSQCIRNLLSSFTRHRHLIHAGYTFAGNGSWILQDGTFSLADFIDAFQENDVQRVLRAYDNCITVDVHCSPEGEWTTERLSKETFSRSCKVRVNPDDRLTAGSVSITNFINYLNPFLVPASLGQLLESSEVVGNIRFSHPTLYIFPGGQGDAALFGINGFNMLVDGGFNRKACFWDFVRHLDRLDAVLMTRLNNGNACGMCSIIRRKKMNHVYPQIGHFFCNLQERRQALSPDGDKDRDPLLVNLMDEGQELVLNLRHIQLRPHHCYREGNLTDPINLYHKVGHGKLDMYVISPARDSREVKDFLSKWNSNDPRLFAGGAYKKEFNFPLQNLISICALLVWQPANPTDTITRILFPGSTPQHKIIEGLEKLKQLEFLKTPVCTGKSVSPSASTVGVGKTSKQKFAPAVIDKILPGEMKLSAVKNVGTLDINKQNIAKSAVIPVTGSHPDSKQSTKPSTPGSSTTTPTSIKPPPQAKSKPERKAETPKKSESNKLSENDKQQKSEGKPKEHKSKVDSKVHSVKSRIDSKPPRSVERKPRSAASEKKGEVKSSPTTPKKSIESKVNGVATKAEVAKVSRSLSKSRSSPTATPAKSAKEANNRKVVESKYMSRVSAAKPSKKEDDSNNATSSKPERKPISRKPKPASPGKTAVTKRTPGSPAKSISAKSTPTPSVKSDKEGVIRKSIGETDKITTDSSTVSTPSTAEPETVPIKVKAVAGMKPDGLVTKEADNEKEEDNESRETIEKHEETKDEEVSKENAADEKHVKDDVSEDKHEKEETKEIHLETKTDEAVEVVETHDVMQSKEINVESVKKDEITEQELVPELDVTGEEPTDVEEEIRDKSAQSPQIDMELDVKHSEEDLSESKEEEDEEDEEEEEYLIIEKEEIEQVIEDSLQEQESTESHIPDDKDIEDEEEDEDEGELAKHLRDEVESEKERKDDIEDDKQTARKLLSEEQMRNVPEEVERDSIEDEVEEEKIAHDGKTEESKVVTSKSEEKLDILTSETKEQIEEEVKEIISSAEEIVTKTKLQTEKPAEVSDTGKEAIEDSAVDELKETSSVSPESKFDISSEKNREISYTDQKILDEENEARERELRDSGDQKYHAEESQPDEKISTTVESGATTTAPTLPEDERIPLDEIKEIIEEKYVKEDTKEDKVPVAAPLFEPSSLPQVVMPTTIGVLEPHAPHQPITQRDIVKTPDEVADLPVHEEVDPHLYQSDDFGKDFNKMKDDASFKKEEDLVQKKVEIDEIEKDDVYGIKPEVKEKEVTEDLEKNYVKDKVEYIDNSAVVVENTPAEEIEVVNLETDNKRLEEIHDKQKGEETASQDAYDSKPSTSQPYLDNALQSQFDAEEKKITDDLQQKESAGEKFDDMHPIDDIKCELQELKDMAEADQFDNALEKEVIDIAKQDIKGITEKFISTEKYESIDDKSIKSEKPESSVLEADFETVSGETIQNKIPKDVVHEEDVEPVLQAEDVEKDKLPFNLDETKKTESKKTDVDQDIDTIEKKTELEGVRKEMAVLQNDKLLDASEISPERVTEDKHLTIKDAVSDVKEEIKEIESEAEAQPSQEIISTDKETDLNGKLPETVLQQKDTFHDSKVDEDKHSLVEGKLNDNIIKEENNFQQSLTETPKDAVTESIKEKETVEVLEDNIEQSSKEQFVPSAITATYLDIIEKLQKDSSEKSQGESVKELVTDSDNILSKHEIELVESAEKLTGIADSEISQTEKPKDQHGIELEQKSQDDIKEDLKGVDASKMETLAKAGEAVVAEGDGSSDKEEDEDFAQDYEGDIEEEEDDDEADDYLGSEYVDSGLEEEPVYGKLAAAALPEYVMVTPDSGPSSPGDIKFFDRKDDKIKPEQKQEVGSSIVSGSIIEKKQIHEDISTKSQYPEKLDEMYPVPEEEIKSKVQEVSSDSAVIRNETESSESFVPATADNQKACSELEIKSEILDTSDVKESVIKSEAEIDVTKISAEITKDSKDDTKESIPKSTSEIISDTSVGSKDVSQPQVTDLKHESEVVEAEFVQQISSPKLDVGEHKTDIEPTTSTLKFLEQERIAEIKCESRTSTPEVVSDTELGIKSHSGISTPKSAEPDKDTLSAKSVELEKEMELKSESGISTPKSLAESEHEKHVDSSSSSPKHTEQENLFKLETDSKPYMSEPSDKIEFEIKAESRTSTPKLEQEKLTDLKIESGISTPKSVTGSDLEHDMKPDSRTSTPKSSEPDKEVEMEIKIDSRTSTPKSFEPDKELESSMKIDSRTSTPKSSEPDKEVEMEIKIDSRTSTPKSFEPDKELESSMKIDSRTSTPKSSEPDKEVEMEIKIDSRTSTPKSLEPDRELEVSQIDPRTLTSKSPEPEKEELKHDFKTDSGTSTPKSPIPEKEQLKHDVKLESGTSTPKSLEKDLKQDFKPESGTSTPKSVEQEKEVLKCESGVSSPRSVENIQCDIDIKSGTSTPKSIDEHEASKYKPETNDFYAVPPPVENITSEVRFASGTSTPLSIDLEKDEEKHDFKKFETGEATFLEDPMLSDKTSFKELDISEKTEDLSKQISDSVSKLMETEKITGKEEEMSHVHELAEPFLSGDLDTSSSTVQRMLVTASSEDGGTETEICPSGSIIFSSTAASSTSQPTSESIPVTDISKQPSNGEVTEKEIKCSMKVEEIKETIISVSTNGHISTSDKEDAVSTDDDAHDEINGKEKTYKDQACTKIEKESSEVIKGVKIDESIVESTISKEFTLHESDITGSPKKTTVTMESSTTVVKNGVTTNGIDAVKMDHTLPAPDPDSPTKVIASTTITTTKVFDLAEDRLEKEISEVCTTEKLNGKLSDEDQSKVFTEKEVVSEVKVSKENGILETETMVKTVIEDKTEVKGAVTTVKKEVTEIVRSSTPGSDTAEQDVIPSSPPSDISSGQASHIHAWDRPDSEEDEDVPDSPASMMSNLGQSPPDYYTYEDDAHKTMTHITKKVKGDMQGAASMMTSSIYGSFPTEEETLDEHDGQVSKMMTSFISDSDIGDNKTITESATYKLFSSGDDEDVNFQKAMEEHRLARGEDIGFTSKTSPKHSDYEERDTKHVSHGLNGHKHSDDDTEYGAVGGYTSNIMSTSFYGGDIDSLPPLRETKIISEVTGSVAESPGVPHSSSETAEQSDQKDTFKSWGKPLGLPAPAPPPAEEVIPQTPANKGTPKKERKVMQIKKSMIMNESNRTSSGGKDNKSKRPESPSKQPERKGLSNKDSNSRTSKSIGSPIYIDLSYVPHHGNSYYSSVEFFKKVRARYYVFSGTDPSREVYDALLQAKQTWEDKELEVTIIPTYDTDTLGYWVAENEDALAKYKIDLSPSASRCTINLQDHETSCSAYRLEF